MAHISGSVGANGKNTKADVETVQTLLNRVPYDKGGPAPPLKVDGLCWQKTTSSSFFGGGKYLPVPLDTSQRNSTRSVFGDSLDLDAIRVLYRSPSGAKGVCLVGPLPGQNTLLLSSTAELLLIHELTHTWQSQHHSVPGKYSWNSLMSMQMAEKGKTSAYWYQYVPEKPFDQYAAEQIADQVENGESRIVAHVRSRYRRFKDPLNEESLRHPRVQAMDLEVAKYAPAKY